MIRDLDTVNICVPTPLRKTKDPDMSYIVAACQEIAKYFHPGMLVILESTTYPGTTDEVVLPMLESPERKVGRDFFLCFSPERVDPGNPKYQTANIPKVVGGSTPACTEVGALFYAQALADSGAGEFHPGGRDGQAAREHLPHDQHRAGERDGHDVRPHGHQRLGSDRSRRHQAVRLHALLSRPGLGGHCIPIDPFYLSWKTKQAGIEARFIELAGYINGQMPHFVVDKVQNALNDQGKPVKGARIHILGVAYKKDIDDVRESPALDIIHLLERRGATVSYSDPHVPHLRFDGLELCSDPAAIPGADCVVIVTDHSGFDYKSLVDRAPLIVDTRNALKGINSKNIVRL